MPQPEKPPRPPPPVAASAADEAALLPLVHAARRAPAWHLVFPAALEARFEADHGRARSRQLVLAGLAALLVYDLFLINDWATRPDVMATALWLRLGLTSSFGVLAMALTHRGLSPAWREGLMASTLVVAMASSCGILWYTRTPVATYDPFLFSLVFMAGNITFALRVRAAVASSAASLALAGLVVSAHTMVPAEAKTFAMGSMLATAVFTCLACYRIERATRQAYLLLLLEALRSQTAQRLADEFALISQTDALTGLPNRRAFDAALQEAWHDARLRGAGLALLMMDVDHFKRYNDHHGHPAGDECLRRVAGAMAAAVREGDLLARIGGEEFALLVREGCAETATLMAERLRCSVTALALPHGGLAPPEAAPAVAGPHPVVTVSLGAALDQPSAGHGPDALMRAADGALYEAKRRGRNCWWLAIHTERDTDPGVEPGTERQAAPARPEVSVAA